MCGQCITALYVLQSVALTLVLPESLCIYMTSFHRSRFWKSYSTLLKSRPLVLVFILGIADEHSLGLVGFAPSLRIASVCCSPTQASSCYVNDSFLSDFFEPQKYNLKLGGDLDISPKTIFTINRYGDVKSVGLWRLTQEYSLWSQIDFDLLCYLSLLNCNFFHVLNVNTYITGCGEV